MQYYSVIKNYVFTRILHDFLNVNHLFSESILHVFTSTFFNLTTLYFCDKNTVSTSINFIPYQLPKFKHFVITGHV